MSSGGALQRFAEEVNAFQQQFSGSMRPGCWTVHVNVNVMESWHSTTIIMVIVMSFKNSKIIRIRIRIRIRTTFIVINIDSLHKDIGGLVGWWIMNE